MKLEILKDWIAALRSGKFLQGTSKLKYQVQTGEYRYCCLGVLRELIEQDQRMMYMQSTNNYMSLNRGISCDKNPLTELIPPARIQSQLASLNDEQNFSFDDIADVLEENADLLRTLKYDTFSEVNTGELVIQKQRME